MYFGIQCELKNGTLGWQFPFFSITCSSHLAFFLHKLAVLLLKINNHLLCRQLKMVHLFKSAYAVDESVVSNFRNQSSKDL